MSFDRHSRAVLFHACSRRAVRRSWIELDGGIFGLVLFLELIDFVGIAVYAAWRERAEIRKGEKC